MNGQHRPALAARLTQRWVRAYTAHLDPDRRDTRRAELASDLWEHEADAKRMGLGSVRETHRSCAGCWRGYRPTCRGVANALQLCWPDRPPVWQRRRRRVGFVASAGTTTSQSEPRTASTTGVPIVSANAAITRNGHRGDLPPTGARFPVEAQRVAS